MSPVVLFCTCKFIHGKKSKFKNIERNVEVISIHVRDLFNAN